MTTDTQTAGAGLLAAILADPADDVPRLIMADWLEEQGDEARAEFIRVQCRLAVLEQQRLNLDAVARGLGRRSRFEEWKIDTQREPLRRRERELLDTSIVIDDRGPLQPRCLWAGSCIRFSDWEFRRGFVAALTCTAADWMNHADAITAAQPIEEVTLLTLPVTYGCMVGWTISARLYIGHGKTTPAPSQRPLADIARELLAAEWPRIVFHLPDS